MTLLATGIVVGGMALLAAALSPVPLRQRLRLNTSNIRPTCLILGCITVLGIGTILKSLEGLALIPPSLTLAALDQVMQGMTGTWLLAGILVIGIMPGITEELLFRGYIQTRLCERWGPFWAIIWTSLMFGIMHLDLVQGSYAVAVGVVLGYITERTGSIIPAMICHGVNNTVATLLTAAKTDLATPGANTIALTISATVVVLAVWYLRKNLPYQRPLAAT